MTESKIQIKIGQIDFSGEGNQDWLANQLDKILDKLPELLKVEAVSYSSPNGNDKSKLNTNETPVTGLSVLNIAGKLSCKSGSDLAIAAAAYLHFSEGRSAFTRDDISTAMKKATGFYKDSYMSNLTTILSQLEKNSTFTKSLSSYSLQANKVTELNAILSK